MKRGEDFGTKVKEGSHCFVGDFTIHHVETFKELHVVSYTGFGGGEGYFEDVVVCLFDPFMCKHFDGCPFCVGIAVTETPAEDPFTVPDTQDAEVADLVHASRVDAATIDCVDVSCSLNDEQNSRSCLFKVKENGSSNLTFISAWDKGGDYALGSC